MARYTVAFWKLVSDDTGHESETLQYKVDIEADEPGTAIAAAKGRFCRFERIVQWSDRADEIRIREIQTPRLAIVAGQEFTGA